MKSIYILSIQFGVKGETERNGGTKADEPWHPRQLGSGIGCIWNQTHRITRYQDKRSSTERSVIT